MSDLGKTALRAQYRAARDAYVAALDTTGKTLAFRQAPQMLSQLFKPGVVVAGYCAIGSEADPRHMLDQAAAMGCTIALPFVVSRVAPMQFLEWQTDSPLVPGVFGLRQPESSAAVAIPDIVMVPLVAFDQKLMRLGQGAGHYDRALSLLPNTVKIGISWSVQQADMLPADPWDIPLDAILTEKAWITA